MTMGVPDDNCPVAPAKKRQRLSLKANKQKNETLPRVAEEGVVRSPAGTDLSQKKELPCDEEDHERTSSESVTTSERDSRVPAVASLENFGNTCFMNSILQVLRYTPGFLETLAQLFQDIVASEKIKRKQKNSEETEEAAVPSFEEENCKKCWKVVRNVHKVYRDLALLEEKYEEVASDDVMSMAVKPNKVLNSVRELNPMFEGNLQHDAQEFLRCLLCYLQDASKEVQKFYCQLPPRLSPRAVVLNPIMQRFLKAAQKIGISPSKETAMSNEESQSNVKEKNDKDAASESVKVNLFPKSGNVTIVEKPEAAKSPSKIQTAPNLGDTASVVDKKTNDNIQSGTLPKGDANEGNDIEMENAISKSNNDGELSVSGQPSRNRGMARRGRRFNPYRKNSSSKSEKYEETKLIVKPSSSKKGKKGSGPVDKLQPCISDMFVTKTYSAKKRLGMSSTVVRKTSEELFDEIKADFKDSKSAMDTSSPRKSQSMPVLTSGLNDASENVDMQPVVSLTNLHGRITPEITSESATTVNVKDGSIDQNSNAELKNTEISKDENAEAIKSVDENGTDIRNEKINETSEGEAEKSRSFQNIFAQFLQGPNCPIVDSDSDSVDLLTDSDNEDIVAQKKLAKRLHESPRRSPRKQIEMYQSSPRRSASLNIQSETAEKSSPRKILSFDSRNNLSLNNLKNVTSSNDSKKVNENSSGAVNVKSEVTKDNTTCKKEENSDNNHDNIMNVPVDTSGDGKNSEIGDRNLFPIVKLEKCDHVFDGGSKSVSANYAAKCLTPMKNSPRKSDPADSSNYLKCRNLLEELEINNENDLQRAIDEMYNSPVKSRSKCDLIERLFQGSMMLRTRCLQCESSRERREEFHDVSVPVRLEQSDSDDEEEAETDSRCGLMKLIEASTEVEKLLEDNKYYCEECKCYVEAERSMLYDVMPDILTLHLKRFSATLGKYSSITKINDEVEIPFTLPCLRYRCPKVCLRPDHKYSLYAVVTHSGVTLTAGHYLAYVRALPKTSPQEHLQNDMLEKPVPNDVREEKPEVQPDSEIKHEQNSDKNGSKMPLTRKKMGITAKLPSRFDDSVTTTKVKAFKTMTKVKPVKPDLVDCLLPSKMFSSEWFECDDETVRVFSEEDFKEMVDGRSGAMLGTPYLLFYHKATMV